MTTTASKDDTRIAFDRIGRGPHEASRRQLASDGPRTTLSRNLLTCGIVAGPLFIVVSLVQVLTRPGFDLGRQPISMLSLGDLGWIQIANFELSGLLIIACAIGIRRTLHGARAGTWGPLLLGAYGLGLVAAGILHPDPSLGFPPGAPAGLPPMSWHAALHAAAFNTAFLALIAACFVFARRFSGLGRRGWMAYSAATGVVPILLIALSSGLGGSGVPLFAMGVITSGWAVAIPAGLLAGDR